MRFCQSYVADLLSNAQFMFTEKTSFPNIVILGVKKKLENPGKPLIKTYTFKTNGQFFIQRN